MSDLGPLDEALRRTRLAATSTGDLGRFASELLPLLEEAGRTGSVVARSSKRGTGQIEYQVEKTQQGEVLTERRLSGKSKPFRCPKLVYDALAKVLGSAVRPLLLDEIIDEIEVLIKMRPPDFQVRLPIRLWLHSKPPMIGRNRSRYQAIRATTLVSEVSAAWDQLILLKKSV